MNESFTDSDDEEILFTKEMVRRLKKSAQQKIPVNSRPTSSLSDASGMSAVSTASGQKKIEDTVESTTQRSSECSPVKETLSSGNVLLSPRYL
ncbi:hypothetical protein RB195_019484 [Necator americanus]|uniref:Uncharacterized protein n=1 Tax=Necator americanus TaxID=51031 RepID=A0ABR1CH84_NECAM